jgi:hypothetical protein
MGDDHKRDAVSCLDFGLGARDVGLYGAFGEEQRCGDLRVGVALSDQDQNLGLAGRETA